MAEGPNFRDTAHLYKVFDYILTRFMSDPEIGPKLASLKLVVQWVYDNPDGVVTFNLKDTPREGFFGDWACGPTEWKSDVITYQSAAYGLAFLQGQENPMAGMVRGKIKAKGNVTTLVTMLPSALYVYSDRMCSNTFGV